MNFTHSRDTITVGLTFPILENEVFEVVVDYEGLPPNSGSFLEGFSRSVALMGCKCYVDLKRVSMLHTIGGHANKTSMTKSIAWISG